MKISFLLYMIILGFISCSEEKEMRQVEKDINPIDTFTLEQVNSLRLREVQFSYQIDSLLINADVFEIETPSYEIVDVFRLSNDSINVDQFGIILQEHPYLAYPNNNPIIYNLSGNEKVIKSLLYGDKNRILFKINSFTKLKNTFEAESEIDGERIYSYLNIDSKDAPFYIQGEIISIK